MDWRRLAEQNRPTDEARIAREAVELASRGLSERDIGQALKLDPGAVRRLLAMSYAEASEVQRRVWAALRSKPEFLEQYTRAKEEAADALRDACGPRDDISKVSVTR